MGTVFHAESATKALGRIVGSFSRIEQYRLEMTNFHASAACGAGVRVMSNGITAVGMHTQLPAYFAGYFRCFQADTAIGAAVTDNAGTPTSGHFKERLSDVTLFSKAGDDVPGFALCDLPGMIFLTMVYPEGGHFFSNRDTGLNWAAVSCGLFAGAVHYGDIPRIFEYDLGGVFKRYDPFRFFRHFTQIHIQIEDFSGIFPGQHFGMVTVKNHASDNAQRFQPGHATGNSDHCERHFNIRAIKGKIDVMMDKTVESPSVRPDDPPS
jgi:hypothetical protein